jgi:ATP-binding cassette subfamily B multidrug efflux pump
LLRFFERLVPPYPDLAPRALPTGFFAFISACTRDMRGYIGAMTVLTAAIGAFEALLFSMLGRVVDWLAKADPAKLWVTQRKPLLALAAILASSTLLIAVQSLIRRQTLAGNFAMRLRWDFHRNMLAQSLSFYQEEFAGRVATKVMQTALAVRDAWMILADILVYVVIYFVTIVLVAGDFSLWLLWPFLGWLTLYALSVWYFVPRLAAVGKSQADARSMMTGRITDAYTNIATVKLFSHTQRESGYAKSAMAEFLQTVNRQMRMVTGFEIVNHALAMGLIVSTGGVTLWLWTRGSLGIGAVAAATAMALRLNGISHWVMWEVASLFEQVGTVQDGIGTLSSPQTIVDRPDAEALRVRRGEIRFESVSFAYGAHLGNRPIIDRLNLHIRPGEKIGLVGRSGAGKSTLVNLLLRFYDVAQGRILIDGMDIAHVTQDSLRSQIAMVTQDTSLLHRSVRDNILYGRPDASEADLIAAATRAEAHDFILGLKDAKGRSGYLAHVGERGVKLSGGQRQRIAIARVMLKNAPILLLDEATSALDSEVESAIQESLYRLMEGKTVVAIAHRLSTIAAMDRLVILDKGRIVEEGDHASLLAHGGIYARLWAHQTGGFLGEQEDPTAPTPTLTNPPREAEIETSMADAR